jgi:glycosyltransferase involved in cell wall biosynthesis
MENRKIKVVVSALMYPLTMARYFINALNRRDDVELCIIGPYSGTRIPWGGGMDLPSTYVIVPDIPLPMTAQSGIPYQLIDHQMPWTPDLWLEIDAGFHFKTKPKAEKVAHILTDPHCLREHYSQKKDADITFCMQTPYMLPGERYLPYAYDPTFFYPEDLEKTHHGCLIGLHYPQRTNLVNALRSKGYNIHYSIGQIFDAFRTHYNQSEIALSWSSLQDLPTRVFEYAGMGLPMVVNRVPDMSNFFVEGEHYLGFSTQEEAVKQFEKLMADDDMRFEMGEAAWRKVRTAHTWDARIQEILEVCKVI